MHAVILLPFCGGKDTRSPWRAGPVCAKRRTVVETKKCVKSRAYSPPRFETAAASWEWSGAMTNMTQWNWRNSRAVATVGAACALVLFAQIATAGPREQAKRMHDRIAGVPPSDAVLDSMAALVPTDPVAAALLATNDPAFYNCLLYTSPSPRD